MPRLRERQLIQVSQHNKLMRVKDLLKKSFMLMKLMNLEEIVSGLLVVRVMQI